MNENIYFNLIDSKNTTIKCISDENENIDNSIIERIFEQYNIPEKYRKFILVSSNFGKTIELITETPMELQNNVEICKDGTNRFTLISKTVPNVFLIKEEPFRIKISQKDLINFVNNMQKDNIFDKYVSALDFLFNEAIYLPLNQKEKKKEKYTYNYIMKKISK